MKKIMMGIIIFGLFSGLCACSSQQTQESNTEPSTAETTQQFAPENPTLSGVDEVVPDR